MNIKNSIAVAVVVCSLPAAKLEATVVPPIGLAPGSQYQLVFATAETTLADQILIRYYNSFVATAATNGVPNGLPSTTWKAVGSVGALPASANAPWLGVPVYNTAGQLVSTAGGIYGGGLTNAVGFDESGNAVSGNVWTGVGPLGNSTSFPLGGTGFLTNVEIGIATATNGTWLDVGGGDPARAQSFPIYALSDILVLPAPDPGSIVLLGLGLAALAAVRWRTRAR